jgi:hypothetical protein
MAGKRAGPLLRDALSERRNLPPLLTLLADLGDRGIEPVLVGFSQDDDPQVAAAAREALRTLRAQ